MIAKQYLRRYRHANDMIFIIEQELKKLREQMDSLTIDLDGMPRGTAVSDKTGELATQLADYEEKLIDARSNAWSIRMDVVNTIGKLTDSTYSQLLYKRYIELKTWERIAAELNYSYMHITRLHGYALAEIEKVL